MINNKWMIISLLIGNILLIATVSSVPLYRNATLQRMLIKEMQDYQKERNVYPGMVDLRNTFSNQNPYELELFRYYRDTINDEIVNAFGIPLLDMGVVENITLVNPIFYPEIPREDLPKGRAAILAGYENIEEHIVIVTGRMYSKEIVDGVIETICSTRTLEGLDILLDEILIDDRRLLDGMPLRVKIVGVFENSLESDPYWLVSPSYVGDRLVLDFDLIDWILFNSPDTQYRAEVTWLHPYDYNKMEVRKVAQYTNAHRIYRDYFDANRYATRFRNNFDATISTYQKKADSLSVTLWVLQVPVFILLAFFIFMVSRQILIIEQNEISVIKSRGANRRQIISIYFLQGLIICGIAAPVAAVPLATFICLVLGSSNGFLNLVQRSALTVTVIPEAIIYSAIAVVFSLLTMTLPVVKYSRVTIVDHKRSQAVRKKPLWQMFYLDVLAFGISLYGLYSFNLRSGELASAVPDINTIDPLLFLCSSLFILGLGLVMLRLYPYIIKLLYAVFKNFWSPAFYASFIKLIRSAGDEQFIMIFLVFTLAVGIFDAKAARTINLNAEDKIKYTIGADLTFREIWANNNQVDDEGRGGPDVIVYQEPDIEKYINFPEVSSLAKVYTSAVTVSLKGGNLPRVSLMAVHTVDFGNTAWSRDDLFPVHFNEYLNAMALDPSAVLLSSNFRDKHEYKVADTLTIRDSDGNYMTFVIHGFVDYWPGYVQIEKTKGTDGRMADRENWLIVANLHFVQSQTGLLPYSIWMKTGENSNSFLYEYANRNNVKFAALKDSKTEIIRGRNDPLLQGTNGVLTVGFVIIIIICAAGFLIYWILAIKSRVLQFGIFRAMGMGFKSIIGMLIVEQAIITGAAIALGILAGEISSRLFVPIIQLAYTASEKVIPFMITTETDDYVRLITITGVMIVSCMAVLGVLVSRIKITQALKLGED